MPLPSPDAPPQREIQPNPLTQRTANSRLGRGGTVVLPDRQRQPGAKKSGHNPPADAGYAPR